MSQPSANSSGGMNSAKKIPGSMCRLDSNGTNESSTPPATSSSGPGSGTHLASAPTIAIASSSASVISIVSMAEFYAESIKVKSHKEAPRRRERLPGFPLRLCVSLCDLLFRRDAEKGDLEFLCASS